MTKPFSSHVLALLVVASMFAAVGCGAQIGNGLSEDATKAIENSLAQSHAIEFHFGLLTIRSSLSSRFEPDNPRDGVYGSYYLDRMKRAEEVGLLEVTERPRKNELDAFLTMGARQFNVRPTAKLLDALADGNVKFREYQAKVLNPEDGSTSSISFPTSKAKIDQITTNDEYKGSLATPGEKHQIVLGIFRDIPASIAAVVGPSFASLQERRFRFRSVIKYNQFKSEWVVVTIDIGSMDVEKWDSSNVK